jgi:DNA-binding MarR family transcriptional regulator
VARHDGVDRVGGLQVLVNRSDQLPENSSGLDRSPIHLLHRATQAAAEVFAQGMRHNGLTPRQLAVLLSVAANEGLSQTGVVERTGIDRSTTADIVKRLQRKGLLLRRRTKQDARTYSVTLTDQGRRALRTAEPLSNRIDAQVLDALPANRRRDFVNHLRSIIENLQGNLL